MNPSTSTHVLPFNRYATIQNTWACGRFVYVRFVAVFRYNSCLCDTVISVDSVLRASLRNRRLITSFYCFTPLVLHFHAPSFLGPAFFRSCIFVWCRWSCIFGSCIFKCFIFFGPPFSGPAFSVDPLTACQLLAQKGYKFCCLMVLVGYNRQRLPILVAERWTRS